MELRSMLDEIAADLAHTWFPETAGIFAALGGRRGEAPTAVLARCSDADLAAAAPELTARVEQLWRGVRAESDGPRWWQRAHPDADGMLCAYFSAEFGLTDSLPIFAGGLGVLAGDHLKTASELGVPLVGVGLFYGGGYFRQGVSADGWQSEEYPRADPTTLAVKPARSPSGEPVQVVVELPEGSVLAGVWRARLGNVSLYLLDTDVDGNGQAGREITGVLYAGDRELRIRQEIVLGVGGVRALHALGLRPTVFHMNEGHSAFFVLERMRALVEAGHTPREALDRVRASTVFTTHTPVIAGNEVFDAALVDRYIAPLANGPVREAFRALGTVAGEDGRFGMTPLALRASGSANAVSRLHGEVARGMWAGLGANGGRAGAAIGHVTNGVHPRTWLSAALAEELARAGVVLSEPPEAAGWERARGIPDETLWRIHGERKAALLNEVAERTAALGERMEPDPGALTIGFARRFATYKRADLLFADGERVRRLLGDRERPVQLVVAGKAHPADDGGKALIQRIIRAGRDLGPPVRVIFLPGYDMTLAQLLVRGCDLWLNTPRRPLEASGTSGMKAGLNGVLNCSILDGWWDEAYTPELGFAIGGRDQARDEMDQDRADAAALHAVLADVVVPCFFDRDDGVPRRWLAMMRAAIVDTGARFSSQRMVRDYVEGYYLPAHRASAVTVRPS